MTGWDIAAVRAVIGSESRHDHSYHFDLPFPGGTVVLTVSPSEGHVQVCGLDDEEGESHLFAVLTNCDEMHVITEEDKEFGIKPGLLFLGPGGRLSIKRNGEFFAVSAQLLGTHHG